MTLRAEGASGRRTNLDRAANDQGAATWLKPATCGRRAPLVLTARGRGWSTLQMA